MLCICILFYFLIMVCGGFIKLFFVKNALNGIRGRLTPPSFFIFEKRRRIEHFFKIQVRHTTIRTRVGYDIIIIDDYVLG